jgi:hypothetical protein
MLRDAGRPLTVKDLAEGAKRRGFQSRSRHFSRMVEVRVRELKRKKILQRAVGQPGFVLTKPGEGQSQGALTMHAPTTTPKAAPTSSKPINAATSASAASPRRHTPASNRSANRLPLKEVLTQILKQHTKPLSGGELAKRVLNSGYKTTSQNFTDVVWAMLPNMDNVEHVPNQGYRLKKARA